jgi:hypothetical protein
MIVDHLPISGGFTLTIIDDHELVGDKREIMIRDVDYVVALLNRHIKFAKPLDLRIVVRTAAEDPRHSNGLLPSQPQWVTVNGRANLASIVKGQTGIDPNGDEPEAGFTIFAGDDGSFRNYGRPLWFDPNPQLGIAPPLPGGMDDFVGIATHEFLHCLGFATHPDKNSPWRSHVFQVDGQWRFSGKSVEALLGTPLPLPPPRPDGLPDDHVGNTALAFQPVRSDLMYQWGNYERNRIDIGQLDLMILRDLGWRIRNQAPLPVTDPIDNEAVTGEPKAMRVEAHSRSSIVRAAAGATIQLPLGSGNGNYLLQAAKDGTVVVGKPSADFTLVRYGPDWLLRHKAGLDGVSLLRGIRTVVFADRTVTLAPAS